MEYRNHLVIDEQGESYVRGSARDITDRVEREQALDG